MYISYTQRVQIRKAKQKDLEFRKTIIQTSLFLIFVVLAVWGVLWGISYSIDANVDYYNQSDCQTLLHVPLRSDSDIKQYKACGEFYQTGHIEYMRGNRPL